MPKIVFYYAGVHNSDVPFAGTCMAIFSAAKSCLLNGWDVVVCGDRISYDEVYHDMLISKVRDYSADVLIMCSFDTVYYTCSIPIKIYYSHCWGDGGWLHRYDKFQAIFGVSDAHISHIREFSPQGKIPLCSVSYCADPAVFKVTKAKDRRDAVVIYAGALNDLKNIEGLIEAVNLLQGVRLLVCGSARMWADTFNHSFYAGNVICLGEISNDAMARYYNKARVVCVPSVIESFSIASVEGQLCGCVACVTPFGGAYKTIEAGVSGVVLKSIGTFDIVEGLREALSLYAKNELADTSAFVNKMYTNPDSFYLALKEFI